MKKRTRFHPTPIFATVLTILGLCAGARATDVPTRGPVINIVEWDGGELPPVYEHSDQLPLTVEDILNLSRNDFSPKGITRMVEERRFVGNASAGGVDLLIGSSLGAQGELVFSISCPDGMTMGIDETRDNTCVFEFQPISGPLLKNLMSIAYLCNSTVIENDGPVGNETDLSGLIFVLWLSVAGTCDDFVG